MLVLAIGVILVTNFADSYDEPTKTADETKSGEKKPAKKKSTDKKPAEEPKVEPAADATEGEAAAPDTAEMMQRWMEAATPGKQHKFLAQFAGEWDYTMKMSMEGSEGEAAESSGTSKARMIMDGRYLQDEIDGSLMGQPFTGTGLTGYDNFKKRYVGTWVDNMGTAMISMQGALDSSGKVLTMYGLMDEPMTGESDKMTKYVSTIVSEDEHVFEIFDLSAGHDTPALQITYKRKK